MVTQSLIWEYGDNYGSDDDDNNQPSAVHGRKETPGAASALRPEGLKA